MKPTSSTEASVVHAMDGSHVEIYPYLPYILQDLWEIGTDPDIVIRLVKRHSRSAKNLTALDLGCGKGAVAIKLAKQLRINCLGIDAIPEFIKIANSKKVEYQVGDLCLFKVGDIRHEINKLDKFDLIILGAIGPVFGDYQATLTALKSHINKNGLIIIDDGYENTAPNSARIAKTATKNPKIFTRQMMINQIEKSGLKMIDEQIHTPEFIKKSDELFLEFIEIRCRELIQTYPAKRKIFEDYIQKQIAENKILETEITCSTIVVKNIAE